MRYHSYIFLMLVTAQLQSFTLYSQAMNARDASTVKSLTDVGSRVSFDDEGNVVALDLSLSVATDNTLAHLADLQTLQHLNMSGTSFSDKALQNISRLHRLKSIDLSSSKYTDADITHIKGLMNLESLDLYDSSVTDSVIPYLTKMRSLRQVTLTSTRISVAGVRSLQEDRPDLSIDYQWDVIFSIIKNKPVLAIGGFTIIFNDISSFAGGGIGTTMPVSGDSESTYSGTAGIVGINSHYKDGVLSINIKEHRLSIKDGGTVLTIGESSIDLEDKMNIIDVYSNGTVKIR